MRSIFVAAFISAIIYFAYTYLYQSNGEEEWWLDVDTMAARWSERGQSADWIEKFRQENSDGKSKIQITPTRINITLRGEPVSWTYQVIEKSNTCTSIQLKEMSDRLKYCVEGNILELSNPKSKLQQRFIRR